VLGHSEGSLVGMVAAQRLGADAFVSVAGGVGPFKKSFWSNLNRN